MLYIVFNPQFPGRNGPTKEYGSFEEAKAEAERLAKKERTRVFVMQAVGVAECVPPPTPPVTFTKL